MRLKWQQSIIFISLFLVILSSCYSFSRSQTTTSTISYKTYDRTNSIVHVVTIPHNSNYLITPQISDRLTLLKDFALQNKSVAIINGGYFDPQNYKTTSNIIQSGIVVADPHDNERLINNPKLKPYLTKILNRSEFRRYSCGKKIEYDITLHSDSIPIGCQLQDSLGAGPKLLPFDTSEMEGFVAKDRDKIIRNAISFDSPSARSAIAIDKKRNILLVMVAQKNNSNSGMSLPQLAQFLSSNGAIEAMNLDGGSSSSLYYQEQFFYGRLDGENQAIERPLKSVLLVTEK